ncbi:MAG: phosphotransferase [Opitutales bacterium]
MATQNFETRHPEVFLIEAATRSDLTAYLKARGTLAKKDALETVDKAGEGNMNVTLRARLPDGRSLILKQSLPWVAKYPQIAAPWERGEQEYRFYQLAARDPVVAALLPDLLDYDGTSRVLTLEDLGDAGDYACLYSETEDAGVSGLLAELTDWLARLHRLKLPADSLPNRAMRELNHQHMFEIPFQSDNGLNLDEIVPGLQAEADAIHRDAGLRRTVQALGNACYLTDGPCLLHGDFFPGSWYRGRGGLRIIDPEFGHMGQPAFDLGVLVAHWTFIGQGDLQGETVLQAYGEAGGPDVDAARVRQLAAVEVLRRLLGVAQLPLEADLSQRRAWIQSARALLSPA